LWIKFAQRLVFRKWELHDEVIPRNCLVLRISNHVQYLKVISHKSIKTFYKYCKQILFVSYGETERKKYFALKDKKIKIVVNFSTNEHMLI